MFINNFPSGSVNHLNFKLNYLGNINLLDNFCISVAGSRNIDETSSQWLENQIHQLSTSTCIVSGLALGADTIAHKSALKNNMPTIAVLPSGFNHITPKTNIPLAKTILKNNGLLLSLLPNNTHASRSSYIARNRVISSIGKFLIVPQFNTKSGTRHTVNFTNELNKPIILPNFDYSGNQFIINSPKFNTIIK